MTLVQRGFSKREQQIVEALCAAKAVKDIAGELDLSVNTVKDYLKTIYRKAQVHSARELMLQLAHAGAPPDTGLAQLLQTAQRLSQEAAPAETLAQLHAAVRACTRARRVSFWRWLRSGGDLYLAGEISSTRPGALLRVESFARQLRAQGWARLQAHEMGGSEGREFTAQGLGGEVIGVDFSAAPRVQVMLAGDPAGGRFGSLDVGTIRLLVRLIHSRDDFHSQALGATA